MEMLGSRSSDQLGGQAQRRWSWCRAAVYTIQQELQLLSTTLYSGKSCIPALTWARSRVDRSHIREPRSPR